MLIAVAIDISKGGLKESIDEICDTYELELMMEHRVIEFPNESHALFFAKIAEDKLENVDMLEVDAQVLSVFIDPEFHSELKERKPTDHESLIQNLNDLFKNS